MSIIKPIDVHAKDGRWIYLVSQVRCYWSEKYEDVIFRKVKWIKKSRMFGGVIIENWSEDGESFFVWKGGEKVIGWIAVKDMEEMPLLVKAREENLKRKK